MNKASTYIGESKTDVSQSFIYNFNYLFF